MMKNISLILMGLLFFLSCKESRELTASQAENLVEEYLEHNPQYESTNFNTSKIRLDSKKDRDLIEIIQELERQELMEIVDENARKKWFSKDSVFVITPSLTQKALPYVVKQTNNRTEVKTVVYKIAPNRAINFERKTDKVATFNVPLIKIKTPFYSFGNDSQPNSDFITKNFKAKYFEEKGWMLVN